MSAAADLREQIKFAPDLPGVYLYHGSSGDVLYVGKALSLRKRLANYLPAAAGR
jgi:excinuclease ABC subunit C